MLIDTKQMVSITEANQNFSRIARLVDTAGAVVILKNNAPRYVLLELAALENSRTEGEKLLAVPHRPLREKKSEDGESPE